MIIKKTMLIILFVLILNEHNIYAKGNTEENPNEISKYYQEQINNEIINPISFLQDFNLSIYNTIIEYIPENEFIENYYYEIYFISSEIGPTLIVCNIFYYEIFLNKYNGFRGDPTRKCFTVEFNIIDYEFIRMYYWR